MELGVMILMKCSAQRLEPSEHNKCSLLLLLSLELSPKAW